jgi:hypothetical protein
MLMKTRDSTFQSWPEMVRATVMATATRPVGTFGRTTHLGQGLDLKMGAGSLNARRAVELADPALVIGPNSGGAANGRNGKTYTFATDFPNGNSSDVYNITVNTTGRLRVVIAWDASATGCSYTDGSGCTGDTIDADIDLWLINSSGFACTSSSYDSSWEICDVAVTAGQTYTAQLHLNPNGIHQSQTYLGIAWNNYTTGSE